MFPPSGGIFTTYVKRTAKPTGTAVRCFRLIWSFRICPRHPRKKREYFQASGSLPIPWAVLPLRGSHRAARDIPVRKSHHAVMVHSCIREAVPDLQTGFRSAPYRASWRSPLMWLLITGLCLKNVYSVVKVRVWSEDPVTTRLLRVEFYRRNGRFLMTLDFIRLALLVHTENY